MKESSLNEGKVMNETNKAVVSLANQAISEEIKKRVKNEVSTVLSNDVKFTDNSDFLETVKNINDAKVQETLLNQYLKILEKHQDLKDTEYFNQVKEEHDNRTKILESELKKDQVRMELFSNRYLIIFFMVFPIIISLILIELVEAYVFASFITLMWYGMILALYFSQSDALNKLLNVVQGFNKKND